MAPEVLCKQLHSYEVDFYAIGIIAYELMMGKVPIIIILEAIFR
jgi:serine/threonine protein kinase